MSTIFADKFKNTSGGNPVQINQLRGIDTAGSITVQGEGTATTNLQQGLCKQWISFDGGESGVTGDSFNTTSFTDVSAGIMTITIANDMASVNYTVSGMARAADNAGVRAAHMSFPANATSRTAGTYTVSTQANNTSQRDCEEQVNHIFGDLA